MSSIKPHRITVLLHDTTCQAAHALKHGQYPFSTYDPGAIRQLLDNVSSIHDLNSKRRHIGKPLPPILEGRGYISVAGLDFNSQYWPVIKSDDKIYLFVDSPNVIKLVIP